MNTTSRNFLVLGLSLIFATAMGCGANSYEESPGDGGDSTEADSGGHHHHDGDTNPDGSTDGNTDGDIDHHDGGPDGDSGNTDGDAGQPCPNGMLNTPNGCECPDGQILWVNAKCVPETCPNGSIRQPDGSCQPPCGNNGVLTSNGHCVPSTGLKIQILTGSASILYWHTATGDEDTNLFGNTMVEKTILPAQFPLTMGVHILPGGQDPTLWVNVVLPGNYLSLSEAEQDWYMGNFSVDWNGLIPAYQFTPADYGLCVMDTGWYVNLPNIWAQFPLR